MGESLSTKCPFKTTSAIPKNANNEPIIWRRFIRSSFAKMVSKIDVKIGVVHTISETFEVLVYDSAKFSAKK